VKNPYKAQLQAERLPYRPILGESSAKTVKGEKIGYLTAICYLVPDEKLCPFAKLAGCFDGCLKSAGRGAFNSVQAARAAKTEFFNQHIRAFMLSMCADIWTHKRRAEKLGLIPLVRPNGTSDIPFENIQIDGRTIFQIFADVQFYDYTKHPSRKLEGKTAGNYDLTYSFSALTPRTVSVKGLSNVANQRTAVVFLHRSEIPSEFRGWKVVDGDDTDVRHIEPAGVVVALYAKGKAKADTSGFVQIKGRDY
jgi:hypothetical protein